MHAVLKATVDLGAAIGDLAAGNGSMVDAMMRIGTAAILVALAGISLLPASGANAQDARRQGSQAAQPVADEISAQQRGRRPTTRLRVQPYYDQNADDVYPHYYPGRNAVRECNATYVQEYRPSGTVIVPRMNCFWRPG
jgi:hypothetical protein